MVTFGKGGWSFEAVYTLPIHLRNFYFKEMTEVLRKEAEAMKPKK